jgi:hypothetical protein
MWGSGWSFSFSWEGHEAPVQVHGHAAGFRLSADAPLKPRKSLLPKPLLAAAAVVLVLAVLGVISNQAGTPAPNLVSKPVGQAVLELHDAGIQLGNLRSVHTPAPDGTVVAQNPRAGDKIIGDFQKVDIDVSRGP